MARATLKLKRPITDFDVDLDEIQLDVLGYAKVVRCKDCIYSKPYNSVWVSPKQPNLLWCAMFDDHREKTWYCADGERKGEEVTE